MELAIVDLVFLCPFIIYLFIYFCKCLGERGGGGRDIFCID